jgi:predicted transcriptional regulator
MPSNKKLYSSSATKPIIGEVIIMSIRIDKVSLTTTIQVHIEELQIIADSVNYMTDKQKIHLLNLSPDEEERKKLDRYNALKEDLRLILESLA